jgi:hypothetical protein
MYFMKLTTSIILASLDRYNAPQTLSGSAVTIVKLIAGHL